MRTITVIENGVSVQFDVHSFGQGAPRVFFTAGVHGDEVTGVYVAQKLIERLAEHPPLRGRVDVIPTVNTAAMRCMQRRCPFDNVDLNRVFPGDANKSISHRLAQAVWRETEGADYLVDLHCCGAHGLPYFLSVYSEAERTRELMSRITLPIAVHSDGTEGQLFLKAARERNQAACIIELPGGGGNGAVNLPVAGQCLAALIDLLRSFGMLPGEVEGEAPTFYGAPLDAECGGAGLWMPAVKMGETVCEGQVIGTLDNKPVPAPASGMATSVRPAAYVRAGNQWVMTYAVPEQLPSEI